MCCAKLDCNWYEDTNQEEACLEGPLSKCLEFIWVVLVQRLEFFDGAWRVEVAEVPDLSQLVFSQAGEPVLEVHKHRLLA